MKISVIIPVYNAEKHLEQCIKSVVGQTYENLEIIIVNDGSIDASGEICEKFAAMDSRISLVHQINGGVSVARNTGIDKATGKYITFVDSDDWLKKEMYSGMMSQVKKLPDLDMIMCDTILVADEHMKKSSEFIREGYYSKNDIFLHLYSTLLVTEDFAKIPIVSACCSLFKRDLLKKNNVRFEPSIKYSEDYLFMAAIMINVNSYFYLKGDFNYNYRQHPESRSKLLQKDWWPSLVNLNKKLKELLGESAEYDFSRQLKLQLIHSALFLSTAIIRNELLNKGEKLSWLKRLFNEPELKEVFKNLEFNKQSYALKTVLYLIKYRKYRIYLSYRSLVIQFKQLRS